MTVHGENPPLAPSLRRLLEQTHRDPGGHVAIEQLAAYRAGALPSAEEERVREHLLACRECSGLLLDLAAFPDLGPPPGQPELSDEDVAAAWRRLEPLVGTRKAEAGGKVIPLQREPETVPASPRLAYALAAGLAAAVVGLLLWNLSLRGRVEELSAPRLGVPVVDLVPLGEARSGGGGEIETVAPGEGRMLVLLNFNPPEAAYSSYEVEVRDAGGRLIWTGQTAAGEPRGLFAVDFPRKRVSPGLYRIVLYGISGEAREEVADFAFEVRPD